MTGQSLVNRVVGYFENHVVQTRSVIGVADIHAGPFAHCIQALEDLDAVCAIRSEEHTSELQSLMRSSYAVFCLQKKNDQTYIHNIQLSKHDRDKRNEQHELH